MAKKSTAFLVILTFLFFISAKMASATFLYDFQFDAYSGDGYAFEADSFSFLSPELIGITQLGYLGHLDFVDPPDLNGYEFDYIDVYEMLLHYEQANVFADNVLNFYSYSNSSTSNDGDIVGFMAWIYFEPDTYGIGTFSSDSFSRKVREGDTASTHHSSGSLTITEVSAGATPVPEPSTLLLLGSGMMGLMVFSRRKGIMSLTPH